MSKHSIRLATLTDAPVVHRLLTDLATVLGKREEMQGSISDLETYGFGEQAMFTSLLAFDAERAVGLAVFFPEFSTWRGTPGTYIQDLYVCSETQGSGLGRQLINATRHHAQKWNSQYIRLTVYGSNEPAIAFYQHLDFKPCHDEQTLMLRY